ncbi:hypothetical protein RB601_009680 [Gaeumannomyces tritici]
MPAMQAQQQHAPLAAGPPPLLYTKRLSGFLQSSLSPQIHSAIVTTLSGKLLAYASRHPVSTLRTQCTVAASIWAIQSAATPPSTAATTPSSASAAARGRARARAGARDRSSSSASSADDNDDRDESPGSDDTAGARGSRPTGSALAAALPPSASAESVDIARAGRPASITVQLSGAVVVIRPLKSPLLFICIGPSGSAAGGGGGGGDAGPSAAQTGAAAAAPASVHVDGPRDEAEREGPSTSAGEQQSNTTPAHPAVAPGTDGGSNSLAPQAPTSAAVVGSPSETTSVLSGTSAAPSTTATSVGAAAAGLTRRHTEELARWLDERLDTLWVPDEGAGCSLEAR